MRRTVHFPAGHFHVGGWRKTCLEFPAHPTSLGESIARVFATFGLLYIPTFIIINWVVHTFNGPYYNNPLPLLIWRAIQFIFMGCFAVHNCQRFTLMRPTQRKVATAIALALIPLAWVAPWWLYAALIIRPVACWRLFVSYFTYPDVKAPGLFKSPVSQRVRLILGVTCVFPTVLLAMIPATLFMEFDDESI